MKYSVNRSSGMSAWFLRGGVAGIAALMLAALVQPAAAAQLYAPDIEVDEGEVAVFKITLPQAYTFALRFRYQTKDGSAKKGRHYEAKQGYLVFHAGTQSLEVNVQTRVSQDATTRDFKLALSERQMRWGNGWSGAWAVIYAPGVPESKTIRAEIRDTVVGATGPE